MRIKTIDSLYKLSTILIIITLKKLVILFKAQESLCSRGAQVALFSRVTKCREC